MFAVQKAMPYPDPEKREGPGHPGPYIRRGGGGGGGEGGLQKKIWSKNKGGLPWIGHCKGK